MEDNKDLPSINLDTVNKIETLDDLISILQKYKDAYGGDIQVDMLFDDYGIDTITRIEETYSPDKKVDSICIMHFEDDVYEKMKKILMN